jgi:hypothetical protein
VVVAARLRMLGRLVDHRPSINILRVVAALGFMLPVFHLVVVVVGMGRME